MKKINVFSIALIAVAMMASCSTNDDVTNQQGGDPNMKANVTKVLRLSISGNNGASRASGAIAEGSEATVNNLVVAVYSNDDNKVEVSSTPSPAFVAGTFTTTIKYNTTKPTILVAANVPDDIFKTVAEDGSISYMTKDEFMTKFINLDLTANDDKNTQLSTQLPMVGSTSAVTQVIEGSNPVENEYEASVNLYRLVSRIKLTGIDVSGLPAGESFTVEEIFVRHANTEAGIFNSEIPAPADLTYFTLSKKTPAQSLATGITYEGMKDAIVKDYLVNKYSGTNVWAAGSNAYFYVFPNYNGTFDTRTQLVIKGTYSVTTTPEGGGDPVTTTETTYYPIEVNSAQIAGKVDYTGGSAEGAGTGNILPNHQYTLSVALTGKGQSPEEFPTEPDPNGAQYNVKVTISVAEWAAEIVQHVTF